MFGVFVIIKILNYRELTIPDPTHLATLLASMQTNLTLCGKICGMQQDMHRSAWECKKDSMSTGKLPDIESVKSKLGKNLYIRKDRAMFSE